MKLNFLSKMAIAVLVFIAIVLSKAFSHGHNCSEGNKNFNYQNQCVHSKPFPKPSSCSGFRTQEQESYAANPSGTNAAMILQNNFNTAFPNGLTIGYLNNKMTFTAYTSVKNFLKTRGRNCSILPIGSFTNPSSISCQSNDLARELVTLSINIGLDNAIPSFGSSATNFKDLLIVKSPFFGWSVQQLLDEGNKKIANNSSTIRVIH